ncbi:PEP-CTERM sorting domain-containing protein [Armatimonas sp.]|uniref:PEP-CTERM sorting domain-containing protein n=1 Tax=Armatimonas sp. TaxID=1872638 RepID=UPI0037533AC1
MTEEFTWKTFRIVSARDADGNVRCALVFKGAAQHHSLELPGKFFLGRGLSAAPEPGTLALALLGVSVLFMRRRASSCSG